MIRFILGYEGNILAHSSHKIEELLSLARLHAEIGSCYAIQQLPSLRHYAIRDLMISLRYFEKAKELEESHELGSEWKPLNSQVESLLHQWSKDWSIPVDSFYMEGETAKQKAEINQVGESSPSNGEQVEGKTTKRIFRRKKKNN